MFFKILLHLLIFLFILSNTSKSLFSNFSPDQSLIEDQCVPDIDIMSHHGVKEAGSFIDKTKEHFDSSIRHQVVDASTQTPHGNLPSILKTHAPDYVPHLRTEVLESPVCDKEDFSKFSILPHMRDPHFMEPLVSNVDENIQVNETFLSNAKTYAEMAHLSYELVKGCNISSTYLFEKYQKDGWTISGFSGLSGRMGAKNEKFEAANRDLPGFVAFQPKTGEAVVVFHGSQDKYDWHNNFDGQMVWTDEFSDLPEGPFLFDGRVPQGFVKRYVSLRSSLYGLLTRLQQQFPKKFHITVVGHSLGGAMGELAVADLSTRFAKSIWGKNYNNSKSNRVRAYLLSGALVFCDTSASVAENLVGRHNVIQDAVSSDPVYHMSGKSMMAYLKGCYRYGSTALVLKLLKLLRFTEVSHPHVVAFFYGRDRHIGYEALQSTAEAWKLARSFLSENKAILKLRAQKWFAARWLFSLLNEILAPIHYGSPQIKQDGSRKLTKAFDPRFTVPETICKRIQKKEDLTNASSPSSSASHKETWYERLLLIIIKAL